MKRFFANVFGPILESLRTYRNASQSSGRRTALQRRSSRKLEMEVLESRLLLSTVHADFNGDKFDDLAIGVPAAVVNGQLNAGQVIVMYGSAKGLGMNPNLPTQIWTQDSMDPNHNAADIKEIAETGDRFGAALAAGDFDGDGVDDLAIGVPGESVSRIGNTALVGAGAVNVLYGKLGTNANSGLTFARNQLWTQDSLGTGIHAQTRAGFGSALAVGNFERDGRDDLVIGAPDAAVARPDGTMVSGAGEVDIIYGNNNTEGLTAFRAQKWTQESAGIDDAAETDDHFGQTLAVGDFNGDRTGDLVIGIPNESIGTVLGAGAVQVIHGLPGSGLNATESKFFSQEGTIVGSPETDDQFGAALATGDFNGDGFDDLAVGVPSEDLSGVKNAGAVNLIFGSNQRLTNTGNEMLQEENIGGVSQENDFFGSSLAAGNFNSYLGADLVVGAPGKNSNAGAVFIGGEGEWGGRLLATGARAGDRFGAALAVGDFNGDIIDDLAVGVPGQAIPAGNLLVQNVGSVQVFHGSLPGSQVNNQLVNGGLGGLAGVNEKLFEVISALSIQPTKDHRFGGVL